MRKIMMLLALLFCAMLAGPAIGESESILAISDTHLTQDPQKHAEMMEAVVQAAMGRDAVLMIGDNTDNAHAEEHALVLRWAEEIEQRTGAEVYIIPGNHDYGAFFGPEKYIAMYDPEDIVRRAWQDLKKGKDVSIYGFKAKGQVALVKLLPHRVVMDVWMKQQKL